MQGESVSQTLPLGAASLPPTRCDVSDPTLPADCDKKPPTEVNKPGSTTHPANPEEAEEGSELRSCSETPGPSDSAMNDAPSQSDVCHTFRSVPVDSEGEHHSSESNNSSMDSTGSSSERHKPSSSSTEGTGPLAEDVSLDHSSGSASTSYSGEEEQEEEELYIPKVGENRAYRPCSFLLTTS